MIVLFALVSLALCSVLVGCDGESSLGRVAARDGGSLADAAADRTDAPPQEPALTCAASGAAPARVDEVTEAPSGPRWMLDATYAVGNGVNLRPGTAVAVGSSIYWGAGDDRCGSLDGSLWWGVRVARVEFDPDRGVHTSWACLPNTWPALDVTMLRVGERVGLLYREHSLLHADGTWTESGHTAGALDLDPMRFTASLGPLSGSRASAQVFGDVVHVLSASARGEHRYARLDGAFDPIDDPVRVGDETARGDDAPLGPIPWGDALLGLWQVLGGARPSYHAEVFGEDGALRDQWRFEDRAGLAGESLRVSSLARIDGGVVALVQVGADAATARTYLARLCEDGRHALRAIAGPSVAGRLVRRGDHWLVALVEGTVNDESLVMLAVDDAGRRAGAPVLLDRARLLDLGDLVVPAATNDPVALYAWRESMTQPNQLRVARVFERAAR